MAKTRADFFNEGVHSSRMGNTNGALPAFAEGNSWQAQAFKEGFNHNEDEKTELAALKKTSHVKRINGREIPRALIEHLNCLNRASATACAPRYMRLRNKIERLVSKWERRTSAGA